MASWGRAAFGPLNGCAALTANPHILQLDFFSAHFHRLHESLANHAVRRPQGAGQQDIAELASMAASAAGLGG
jgi:hypothetical protein